MSIEARKPPAQIVLKLQRLLGGKAGWNGVIVQFAFAAILGWIGYEIISNARSNLANQRIAAGFGFLANNAGFDVNQTLIAYTGSDTFLRVFVVGLLNTLVVSAVGIVVATVMGFIIALCRLSPNWLLARLGEAYVEIVRNLPLLFQILFWYLAVLAALPSPRQSIVLSIPNLGAVDLGRLWVTPFPFLDIAFISNRGLVVPRPIAGIGYEPFLIVLALGVLAALGLRIYARRALLSHGRMIRIWPWVLGLLIGLPFASLLIFGIPFTFELPQLKGFNFAGGSRLIPEFVALTVALSTYTAAFIAEIVRAGILSVHKGQMEAGASLGLSRGITLRLIVVPQAMRVIVPPLTNQYLNLTKNSSLAVAIGYPDLVSVFAGTSLSQTGQAIEIIAMTMGVYLLISLVTSALMSIYGWRLNRSLGA